MQVMVCSKCGTKNRVEESRLATSEAKCGRCGENVERLAAAIRIRNQSSSPIKPSNRR